jgi:DNA-binding NtrC family response regulator
MRGRLHAVVDAFLNTADPMIEILRRADDGSDPAVHAMRRVVEARWGEFPLDEALSLASEVFPPPEGTDHLFYAMLLSDWSLAARERNAREGLAIARLSEFMTSDEQAPPEIVGYMLHAMKQYLSKGDRAGRWLRVLATMRAESPRRHETALSYLGSLATLGRLSEAEDELAHLDRSSPRVQAVLFLDAVETGRVDEAEGLGKLVVERSRPWNRHMIAARVLILRIMRGERFGGETPLPNGMPETTGVYYPAAISSLLDGRPAEAMRWAREEEKRMPGLHSARPTLQAQVLIRSELALGNAGAARRILEARVANTGAHYVDDLFRARLALLEGDRGAAARHFAVVRESCRRYRAELRLEFELRMACELSPADVMAMMHGDVAGGVASPAGRPPARAGDAVVERTGAARLVGASRSLSAVRGLVAAYGAAATPVLIAGETGTGKELAARAIHEASPRSDQPFVAVDCGAISENLLASELFGHRKGAFTGAERAVPGVFVEAGGGTIFLDEIGELTPRIQSSLLRVLETGEIRPVGASRPTKVGCRVVAASNAALAEMVEKGAFRKDLYYRIQRLTLCIPPLRERVEDIVPLAVHFLSLGRRAGEGVTLSAGLRHELERRSWPGNVRELRNEMERMRLLNSDKRDYDLPDLGEAAAPYAPGAIAAGRAEELDPGTAGERGGPPRAGSDIAHPRAAGADREMDVLGASRTPMRRRQQLRGLFVRHRELGTSEVCKLLGVTQPTATSYLKALCAEGIIEKVRPNASPRTHYYRITARE